MNKRTLVILAFAVLLLGGRMAHAAQEWKLLFSMQADKNGVALSHPAALFVDARAERYYVVDSGHNRLISFGRDGQLLQAFNAGGALEKPIAMIKRGDGHLLLLEKGKGALTEIDLKSRAVVPHRLEDQGRALYPQRLKAGEQGLYLLDKVSGSIVLLDAALAVSARISCPDCQAGYADFSLQGGTVYALPMLGTEVRTFDGAGKPTGRIALSPPPEFPVSLALDPAGGFLIVERHRNQVAQYQADGRLLQRHLGPGHKEGGLSYPTEIQVDPWGRVCIVDEGNGRVSVYQP